MCRPSPSRGTWPVRKVKRPSPTENKNPVLNTCEPIGFKQTPAQRITDLENQVQRAAFRSPIEECAAEVANHVSMINMHRGEIASYERSLAHHREQLAEQLLQHQLAIAKFRELGAVAQPTS